MHSASYFQTKKTLIMAAAAVLSAAVLALSMLTSAVAASSVVQVTSNIADVPNGASLTLNIGTQNDGDVYSLEVDHTLALPEFNLYADEDRVYGNSAADFAALGVTATYDEASSVWTLDLGERVTEQIRQGSGSVTFHFVLRDADRNILWGSMNPTTAENTFSFNLVEGTGDELVPEPSDEVNEDAAEDEDDAEAVIPGVPNTSVAQ